MWKKLILALIIVGLIPQLGYAQDTKAALEGVAKAMGTTDLKSLQYTGSGAVFAVGQSPAPGTP
jgi:hypothetical protein